MFTPLPAKLIGPLKIPIKTTVLLDFAIQAAG